MRRVLRYFLWGVVILAVLSGLFGYFVYTPNAEVPRLSGKLIEGTVETGGLKRTYLTYVPRGLGRGAPLVVVMHGSGGNSARMRIATGYGFERLADERGFAVVYPDGFEGYWNACNIVGDYSANKLNVDDVGFLTTLIDKLAEEIGIDRARVFATGISRGGHMAFRLALEAPFRFRAIAAVAANVPTPENFKCKPAGQGTSSILIMNGTKDPLNPFDGGDVSLFGLFISRGKVRSSRGSAQYFADLNNITGTPEASETEVADGVRVERVLWRNDSHVEVELVATRRRTRHASALLALSALIGSYAQGAERTGGDMGLLRATAVELATVARVESNGVAFGGRSIPCSPLIRVPKWTKIKTWNQPSPDFGPTRQVSADMKSQLNRPAPS